MASRKKPNQAFAESGVADDADASRLQMRRIISHAGAWKQKPYKDDDELEERCGIYKNLIAAKDPPEMPTAESFAMFLGISFYKLRKMTKGDGCTERAQKLVQDVITWMSAIWSQASVQNMITPVNYIWYGKNWFEMREPDTRLTFGIASPLKELPTIAQLEDKYSDIPEAKSVKEAQP